MLKVKKPNKIIFIFFILFFLCSLCNGEPFLGGFFYTYNFFENNKFMTMNSLSFFLDQEFNDYVKFYTRLSTGFKFYTDLPQTETQVIDTSLSNFSFIPNIDLLYFEFQSKRKEPVIMIENNALGATNYDLFFLRIGRIHITQGAGFFLNMKGDGLDSFFTLKNFRFRLFGITNSFNFLPFFDFIEGTSNPIFTNWDRKRYPILTNWKLEDNTNGFISDIKSTDYNFYFDNDYDDYTDSEKSRLNKLRSASVIAGRVFTGFTFELIQIFFQNFSINFVTNIDLIPNDFVHTFPDQIGQIDNTFGGKYTSFYFSFNANGKIYKNLYYNFEAIYETGFNATYYQADTIKFEYEPIHSFALNAKFSYFFNHVTKPTVHIEFMYAHGDKDVQFRDDTIINKEDYDNNYKAPNSPQIGYAVQPIFSNIAVIAISQTIKPLNFLKKSDIFSRFSIESVILIYMRPVIKGSAFITEKSEYMEQGLKYENYEKAYLGIEFDLFLLWAIFSDLKAQVKGGIFIPNGLIYTEDYTPLWRVGLSLSISF
ncbi:MAG: alginate export family protein [Spirochaetes bacterium]|nr:alginate export family protein [Spirochaetota bacterium]